jgi:coenzyme F420-reducing hydrogenase alpha subunit
MRKTAMIELRDKLLEEVQNLKEASQTNEHLKGYREALKNVANDIDAQMILIEREQHGNTWDAAIKAHDDRGHVHARSLTDFDDYEIGS